MNDWAISRENQVFDDLAYAVGFFLGDGSLYAGPFKSSRNGKIYHHNDVVFVCSDIEPVERVQSQLEQVWGKRYSMQTRTLPSGLPHYALTAHRREIFEFFSVNTAMRHVIPAHYFSADKEVKKELLRGLMDTDGHCAEFIDAATGCPRWQLGFSNNKRELIQGVAVMFQSIGVRVGKITEMKKSGYADVYGIHPNARHFHESGMSFYAKRKQARFDRYVGHVVASETLRAAPMTMGEDIVQPSVKA